MWRHRSSSAGTEPRFTERLRLVAALLALLLAAVGLTGCGGHDTPTVGSNAAPSAAGVSPAVAFRQEQHLMDLRVRAVRDKDLHLFLKRVDHSDKALMARQTQYFQNLVQLPLAQFGYRVSHTEWDGLKIPSSWGSDVHVPLVRMSMQLAGFDAVPVQRTVGFAFSFRHGRATIVSDRTFSGQPLYRGVPAPWDLTAVTVRQAGDVLGVFDAGTRSSADTVMSAVRDGISDIDRAVPFSWSGRVVVYSVKDPKVLASFRDVPGGAIEHLGAMTFPTYAGSEHSQVASTRMLLMPSSVAAGQPFLGRITRHELTHVAVGVRDDGSPTWVSEGIAEYLGARDVPQNQRIIPTSALSQAQTWNAGMPASKDFNDSDQEWHYALSWMAFDYIAATFGESRMWELIDAMHNGGDGTSDADQDRVLEQVLGFDSHQLALRAAARIRNIYG